MPTPSRRVILLAAVIAATLLAAALGLAACGGLAGNSAAGPAATVKALPERIIAAPRALLAATAPDAGGTIWAVAGGSSVGLFRFSSASGHQTGSVSVNQTARSVAQNPAGVVAIALGTASSGALELTSGTSKHPRKIVALPAPAVQVVGATGSNDFYVLTAWATSASVSEVSPQGRIIRTVPAPAGAVSLAVGPVQSVLYVLQKNGLVDEIGLYNGIKESTFTVRDPGESIALSPDGGQLYVLKGTSAVSNIAVVDVATESIAAVLPAPSHCVELTVSPDGKQLYEVVGAPGYGNIQVFGS
jgi:hypothetical protein